MNCYDCEAEGGTWQGAGTDCTPNPCEECTVDEDCDYCNAGYKLVPSCSGISSDLKCCDNSAVAWIDDPGDPRQGNCVSDCAAGSAPDFNIVSGDAVQPGSCCDDVCFEGFPCPP